ncbi:DUF2231 domain-containing protein [Desulfogranum marinum]|uniref:DUF2231 domain-containing protein n=1 Tax=Desulfogranum marinum TaxID=453220 RepID=UPI001962D77F|nr:DUF2231 domain-containing protein [Desulfogranum marinum]MBM9513513.1 hypothetical protein [Desulfogranum marinum]
MTTFIYGILESVGFTHPLHPAATHIPMGMVMGCFFFGLIAWYFNKQDLRKTALHCSVLALIFIFPTIIAGILDWQYFYGGTYQPLIVIKMVLAAVLVILLGLSIKMNRGGTDPKTLFIVYVFCLVCATGLGFSGGELVYGG